MRTCLILLLALSAIAAAPATRPAVTKSEKKTRPQEVEKFFASGYIPRFRIEIPPDGIESLRKNPRTYVRATVREIQPGKPDRVLPDVAIHLKAGAGSFRPVDDRPALTLNVNKFSAGRTFYGLTKFHLNNSVQDPAYLCENIGGSIYRDVGMAGPRVTNARVMLNNRNLGFYVFIEGQNRAYLKHFFGKGKEGKGILYDGGFCADIDQNMRKMVDDPDDKGEVRRLVNACRESDPARRRQKLESLINIDRFYTFMAIEAMMAHWDGYCFKCNNYRLYHDPVHDKFIFVPHGMDQLFGQLDHPLVGPTAMVAQAVLQTPEDRARYMQRVAFLRERVFDPDILIPRINQIAARILPVIQEMGPDAAKQFTDQAVGFRQRVLERIHKIDGLITLPGKPLRFESDLASVSAAPEDWAMVPGDGKAEFDRVTENGRPCLRIRSAPGGCWASFRTSVHLNEGRYLLHCLCRTTNVVTPAGPNTGAGLRIIGGKRQARVLGTSAWRRTEFEFQVAEPADIILICELQATSGEALFDLTSLKIRRR